MIFIYYFYRAIRMEQKQEVTQYYHFYQEINHLLQQIDIKQFWDHHSILKQ